jgi:WD40 repeat protein
MFIAGLNNGKISIFDIRQNKEAHLFEGHTKYISALLCNANGSHIASGSWDHTVKMWDLRMLSYAATLIRHVDWVQSITALNDFRKIVSGSRDGAVKIWDLSSVIELDNIKELTKSMHAQNLTQSKEIYTDEERIALLKKITGSLIS